MNQTLVKNLPYKTLDDLAPVVLLAKTANVLAIKPSLGINNLQELIAYAKKNPGKLSYGSFGNGTTPHFAGEMLKTMAGIDMVHVPYKGLAPALTDLIGGQTQAASAGTPPLLPHVRSEVDVVRNMSAFIQPGGVQSLMVPTDASGNRSRYRPYGSPWRP